MGSVAPDRIHAFLEALGQHFPQPATLFLLGGSALCMLGSPRPTLDIDYFGDDTEPDDLQRAIAHVAEEMRIDVEPVPIAQFTLYPQERRPEAYCGAVWRDCRVCFRSIHHCAQ